MFTYKCPECETKVPSEKRAKPGQEFRCPQCDSRFMPLAETIALKDDDDDRKPKKAKKPGKPAVASAPASPPPPAEPPRAKSDDDSDEVTSYGVVKESKEEEELAKRTRMKLGSMRDKFAKSARGPASSILVIPANLLIAQGALLAIIGVACVIIGLFPIMFTDGGISDEETTDCMGTIFFGIASVAWGTVTLIGAFHMAGLGSYGWALTGAVFGLLPLLAGIFGLIVLRDPRVLAGFDEPETGPAQNEDPDAIRKEKEEHEAMDEDDDDEDEDEGEDDDDEEEDDRKSSGKAKKSRR